jgi:endonuclease/exonuclease/phosphatase family metal-dependent hydrolase
VQYLDALERSVSGYGDPLIIAGDFNAKAYAWGPGKEDPRGGALAEFTARRDLRVQNRGSEPTFVRGDSKSVIDVTFTARTSVFCWKVCSDWEVMSDHVPILFELGQTKGDLKGSDPGTVPAKRWIWEKKTEKHSRIF